LAVVGEHVATRAEGDEKAGGFYLQFAMPAGEEGFVQNLEDRRRHIELVSVRQEPTPAAPISATVFVPYAAADYLQRKLEAYRTETTKAGRPRHETLINRIDSIGLAAIRSVFTDEAERLPPEDQAIWWEVWVRGGLLQQLRAAAATFDIRVRADEVVTFPEREVILAFSDLRRLGRLMTATDAVAEIRLAKDTPRLFLEMKNLEQRAWVDALLHQLQVPGAGAVSVCVLDSGITHTHPLLTVAVHGADLHSYRPQWGTGDSTNWQGHGTAMSGIALYGDLQAAVLSTKPVRLSHRLESVKMLDPTGIQHQPHLYGAVTAECVARPEVTAPGRPRAFCMAVTSDYDVRRGRPSSWSAAIDALCFGDETVRRLFVISAGNVPAERIPPADYLSRNDIEPIYNPAQAWNALVVGATTEKLSIVDPAFAGWVPLAPAGELSPTSRTSLTWERQWPIKPDVVCEGGNWATDGTIVDCPDDLAVLTTHHQPDIQHFAVLGDTSAATAQCGNIAGRILAVRPDLWPETVRGLIVHSAEWTPAMRTRFQATPSRLQRLNLTRRYGYGVPDVRRALYSALNDATLMVEDSLQPFWQDHRGEVKTRDMHLHSLPWPRAELEQLGEVEVDLRVTLSYFVEPNPGERGWTRRHRYASHGLRFAVKRELENTNEFRARINRAVQLEEAGANPVGAGPDEWFLGSHRNVGSVHSDIWTGTAAELARRDAIAVYPVGGWWKEKPNLARYDRRVRYALIVSIRAVQASIDIYTPIQIAITTAITV
jgi:hypothetical protein